MAFANWQNRFSYYSHDSDDNFSNLRLSLCVLGIVCFSLCTEEK